MIKLSSLLEPVRPSVISIRRLLTMLYDVDEMERFLNLVEEYLPQYKEEIEALDLTEKIQAFSVHFAQEYFPLQDVNEEWGDEVYSFNRQIPLILSGWSYDDYHCAINDGDGAMVLMMCFASYPFNDDWRGARLVIAEECEKHMDKKQLKRIPAKGFEPNDLHEWLDKTKYEGLANYASWLHGNTGHAVLDYTYEECELPSWDMEEVLELKKRYPSMLEYESKIIAFSKWLREKPKERFIETLEFILKKRGK